ncbi:MAG TPA: hypothetical protein DCZ92_02575 [Elusimicrobia bacterium]|nr:hypothetical protein [Elusimicrobiota bacterium]
MQQEKPQNGRFILIVDDDHGTRELEAQCLEPLNLSVRKAASAEEAVGILKTAAPELMLLDYSLPGANAVELVEQLKAGGIAVPPFLMVTGRGDEAVAVEAMKSGALDYIVKNADFLETLLPQAKKALERVALLNKLKDSERQTSLLSQAIKNSFDEVYLFDAVTFKFIFANLGASNNLGYSQEELAGLTPWDIKEGFTEESFRLRVAPLLREEVNLLLFEAVHTRKDGTTYPVQVRLQFISTKPDPVFLAVINDTTEQREAENRACLNQEKAVESEKRFQALLDASPDGFMVRRGHKLIYINASGLKMLGVKEEGALLGRDVLTLLPEELRPEFRRRMEKTDSLGVSTPPTEIRLPRPDGRLADVEISGSPIVFGGEKCGMIFFRDISERKKAERLMQEMANMQRVESLGALAGGIAHDFNNMLTGITANLSLLREKAGNAENEEIIRDTLEAARSAQTLTSQLLAFSKGGKPVKKEFCFERALRDIFSLATRGSKTANSAAVNENLWSLEGDENQLKQALNNLLVNAIQAMPDGGKLRLEADNAELQPGAGAGLLPPGKYLRLLVSDTGIGIPKEYLDRIFEPYFTTKTKGHGLGLSMTWSVIKNHGGHIEARSEPGKGSTFDIFLPATGRCLKAEARSAGRIQKGTGRILVLEDEELVSKAAGRMLAELGYTFELTSDGRETLRRYSEEKAAGRPFSAVILDLTIPGGMGGKETGLKLRRLDPAARIVVSSGYSDEPVMSDYRSFGFDAVLPKPYKYEDLAATLTALLAAKK